MGRFFSVGFSPAMSFLVQTRSRDSNSERISSDEGHGRKLGLKAGTYVDARSFVISGENGGLAENIMNKKQGEEEAIVLLARLPLDQPPWTHEVLENLGFGRKLLYLAMSQAPWFSWNSKLAADIIALLHKQKQFDEAETLTAETLSRLSTGGKRELCIFYCHLINSQSKHKSREPVLHCCAKLKRLLLSGPTSLYLKQSVYKSMIEAICHIGLPSESEKVKEMRRAWIMLTRFESMCIVYGYGIIGQFGEMMRMITQMGREGFRTEMVTSNMVLSFFGARGELLEMAAWLQKMKDWGVASSIRTYISVLNNCPKLNLLLYDSIKNNEDLPRSLEELVANLSREECSVVLNLATERKEEWGVELDLHGMHLGTAYLIMLLWFEEVRSICESGDNDKLPSERVVCGVGNHSAIRGKSPVKGLVKKMLQQMGCPLRTTARITDALLPKGGFSKTGCHYIIKGRR